MRIIKGDYKYYAVRYPQFAKERTKEERAKVLKAYNEPRMAKNMGIVNPDDPMAPYSHFSLVPGGGQAENESYGKVPSYFDKDQLYNIEKDPNEFNNLMDDEKYRDVYRELKELLEQHLSEMPGEFKL